MATITTTTSLSFDAAASLTVGVDKNFDGSIAFTSANDDVWPSFTVTKPQSKTYGPFGIAMTVVITVVNGSLDYTINGGMGGFGYDTNGNVTSLVSGDGTPISFAGPAYTWVNRPAAASNAGMVIRITDIGPTGFGSMWMSDGTNWRTLSGRQVLVASYSGAPGAALATATATGKLAIPANSMVSGGSIVLPIGLPRAGTGLRASILMRHTGTAATFSAALRWGTLNTSSDNSFASCQGAATNDLTAWALSEGTVTSSTTYLAKYLIAPNGAAGSVLVRTTNFDVAQQMYLGIHVSALTAPDTLELLDYSVDFMD